MDITQITPDELSNRLNKNGWVWCLVSELTPGIIRIQLAIDGEETKSFWRKCIEASSLDQAIRDAEEFVNNMNAKDSWLKIGGKE